MGEGKDLAVDVDGPQPYLEALGGMLEDIMAGEDHPADEFHRERCEDLSQNEKPQVEFRRTYPESTGFYDIRDRLSRGFRKEYDEWRR